MWHTGNDDTVDKEGCGLRHGTHFLDSTSNYLTQAILCAPLHLGGHTTGSQRHQAHRLHCGVSERYLLTKVKCRPTFRRYKSMDGACELQAFHESFGFHNSLEERGKEHDTFSLRACDPDKHVYALGSFISKLNKGCHRRG